MSTGRRLYGQSGPSERREGFGGPAAQSTIGDTKPIFLERVPTDAQQVTKRQVNRRERWDAFAEPNASRRSQLAALRCCRDVSDAVTEVFRPKRMFSSMRLKRIVAESRK